jgi:hypothetical protein
MPGKNFLEAHVHVDFNGSVHPVGRSTDVLGFLGLLLNPQFCKTKYLQ